MIPPSPSLDAARAAYDAMAVGAVLVAHAVPRDALAALRSRLEARPFELANRADRGRYAFAEALDEGELVRAVEAAAMAVVGERATVTRARAIRFTTGDYALFADDELARPHPRRMVEVTLDASESASDEAQVVYALRSQHFFAIPQIPGTLAVVERALGVARYDRYLNHRTRGRTVLRLRFALALG